MFGKVFGLYRELFLMDVDCFGRICMCLDGYNLHSGSCRPSLTKWYDPSIIWILVCSIILLFVPSSKNPQVYLIVCILLFIWGVNLATSLQIEYSRYC